MNITACCLTGCSAIRIRRGRNEAALFLMRIYVLPLCRRPPVAAPIAGMISTISAFRTWLQELEEEAIGNGISPETVHSALEHAMLDERVVDLDQKQPETTVTFAAYSHRIPFQCRPYRDGRSAAGCQFDGASTKLPTALRRAAGSDRRALGHGKRLRPQQWRLQHLSIVL